jgi:DNA-binding transcriptional ArsR family regulator
VKVDGDLRDAIMAQLADPDSRRIINATLREAKTAQAIGKELDLPTSTLYRKIADLKRCGLLMADRIVTREDGKREPAYACTFAEVVVRPGEKEVQLEVVLTERGMERKWFELFFPKAASDSQEQG